jgi:hypothetical protein
MAHIKTVSHHISGDFP